MNSEKEEWAYTLCIDGRCFSPTRVRAIDLDHGFSAIFGDEIMRYKRNAYELTFDVVDKADDGKAGLRITPPFSLEVQQGNVKTTLRWGDGEACCCSNYLF